MCIHTGRTCTCKGRSLGKWLYTDRLDRADEEEGEDYILLHNYPSVSFVFTTQIPQAMNCRKEMF